jgi:HSP20 family molecular chaperone IbpA
MTSLAGVTRSRDDVARSTATTEAEMYPQRVPVNVHQTTGALVVVAPLPAVQANDVTVEVHPGDPATLRFWARVRSASPRDFLVHEWDYGGYERELELPPGFGSGVEATLNNGQLAVRVLRGEPIQLSITPSVLGSKPES